MCPYSPLGERERERDQGYPGFDGCCVYRDVQVKKITSVGEDVEKEPFFALLVGMETGSATIENSTTFLKKIKKVEQYFDPTLLLLGI